MIPISIQEVITAVNGQGGAAQGNVATICTDSRKIVPGCLFIPLVGDNFNGHAFITEAFEKGAAFALSQEESSIQNVIHVADTKKALMDLAAYYLRIHRAPVVAVTGSSGKTSTKELIASVLSLKYKVLKTQGNFNNEIGLPLTLFQLENEDIIVLEMGMNHFGEIHNLSKIARPDVAVLTNIGLSHIEALGSQEGILQAKSEIFDFMAEDAPAVIQGDDPFLLKINRNRLIKTGLQQDMLVYASEIRQEGTEAVRFRLHIRGESISVCLRSPGVHMVKNALLAAAVGDLYHLTLGQIQKGLERFEPPGMRMDIIRHGSLKIIHDAYNSNPDSLKAAAEVLQHEKDAKALIVGDMLELGQDAPKYHHMVGESIDKKGIDKIICIGPLSRHLYDALQETGAKYYPTKEAFYPNLQNDLKEVKTILVKASRGMHFEEIVEKIQEVKNE